MPDTNSWQQLLQLGKLGKLGHVGAMTKQQQAVHALAKLIAQVYDCLEKNHPQKLAKAGERVISQYLALESATKSSPENSILCDRACQGWNQ